MKPVRLFEQFVYENIFTDYDELVGYEFQEFMKSYLSLHPNNETYYDSREDYTYGYRKGQKEAHWKYDHEDFRLYHDIKNKQVLNLINFKKNVAKGHPWAK